VMTIGSHFADLKLQPHSEQRPFKVSYFLTKQAAIVILPQLENLIKSKDLDVEVIYSDGKDLDILPRNANKGSAMSFLQQKWGIDSTRTVVCGDSGNDISLFSAGQEKGIIVGNVKHELLDWFKSNGSPHHYLATEFCAKGIIQGLDYFGF
jgi:sucrose-6-phosphatase